MAKDWWANASKLRETGATEAQIAQRLGKSRGAVARAINSDRPYYKGRRDPADYEPVHARVAVSLTKVQVDLIDAIARTDSIPFATALRRVVSAALTQQAGKAP